MIETTVAGARVALLPERAAYLPAWRTLLVADAHIGKAVAFRRLGVPVPRGTTAAMLATLSTLIDATGAQRVVFLGDLLHSKRGRAAGTLAAVERWRGEHGHVAMTLVRGNHDRGAGDPPAAWGVDCVDEPHRVGPFALAHHPHAVDGAYVLAGHIHPAAVVGGRGFDRLRLPCFHFGAAVGVLPAFGAFTGCHVLARAADDCVFLVADGRVWPHPRNGVADESPALATAIP